MPAKPRTPIRDKDLKGLKYFQVLEPLLERLHDDATARDHAGNRQLFYDPYACRMEAVLSGGLCKFPSLVFQTC